MKPPASETDERTLESAVDERLVERPTGTFQER